MSSKETVVQLRRDIWEYVPAVLLPAFINFISLALFTRFFLPDEYGRYMLLTGAVSIAVIFFSQWALQSAQKYRPVYIRNGEMDSFNGYLSFLIAGNSVFVFIAAVPGYAVIRRYELLDTGEYIPVVLLVWSQMMFSIGIGLLQSDAKVRLYRQFQIGGAILKFGFGIVFIHSFVPGITGLLYGAITANLLLIVPLYIKSGLWAGKPATSVYKKEELAGFALRFLRYGFPMIGWATGTAILDLTDRYFLEWFGESGEVGIYAANYSLAAAMIGIVSAPIFSVAHPAIMNARNDAEVSSFMTSFTRMYLYATAPVAACIALFHKEIGRLILGAGYGEGSIIMPVVAAGFFVWNLSIVGHKGYEYKEKTNVMLGFVAVSAALNILLNSILIPDFGYVGAAAATLAGLSSYTLLIYLFSLKYVKWVIPFRFLKKMFAIMILTLVPVYTMRTVADDYLSDFWVASSGGLAVVSIYFFLLFVFGELKLDRIKLILSRLLQLKN